MNLSKNIKSLRRERGMTQEAIAEALGVSVAAVHKWESGNFDTLMDKRGYFYSLYTISQ